MLELKDYQRLRLEDLERFFRRAAQVGARTAFMEATDRPYKSVKHFPERPYVCLRVPTGGGKTLMAAHAVGIAAREFLQADAAVCLWLVPTNAIREQTLAALKDRAHPWRHALAGRFAGPVTVLDLAEALAVQPGTLAGETVVIVSTLAAFRVEDTEGRKVYESAGQLMSHFSGLTAEQAARLERNADGTTPFSLANVLRLHAPVVVMDEAHNARTELSFDTLARFHPSCVIEFTATPERVHDPDRGRFASNILSQASAKELKAEHMVKLPVRLELQPDWPRTVAAALAKRQHLEDVAARERAATGEYIRPIVLFQAQPKSAKKETVTVERLRQHLVDECQVRDDQIAVSAGNDNDLKGLNLSDPDCPIRFILTVAKLKEGWDCSFAYVLCSVAELGSATAVEQVLGRVLRLPNARKKTEAELNLSYAFVKSEQFQTAAAGALTDALVESGFERIEAPGLVVQEVVHPPGLYPDPDAGRAIAEPVPEAPRLGQLPDDLRGRVTYDEASRTMTVTGPLSGEDAKALEGAFRTEAGKAAARRVFARAAGPTAVAGVERTVPWLAVRGRDGRPELFEDQFLDFPWKLTECDPALTEAEFPTEDDAGTVLQIDVTDRGKLEVQFAEHVRRQLRLFEKEPGWDLPALANWLDRKVPHPDISPVESRLFLLRALEHLGPARGLSAEQLGRRKHRLIGALAGKIDGYRQAQARRAYQQLLFGPDAAPVVAPTFCFHFAEGKYAPSWYYDGPYRFQKHLFPTVGELKAEGEEYECAVLLDQLPEVSTWVRNLERKPGSSFWLQTPTDRFYPDFVAFLTDGRRLVVEYKGADRWTTEDSVEKRDLGALWESASDGLCLFVMPRGPDWQAIRQKAGPR